MYVRKELYAKIADQKIEEFENQLFFHIQN